MTCLTTTGSSYLGLLEEDKKGVVYLFFPVVGQSLEILRYDTDRYGRTVADLFVTGEPDDEEMVRSGHGEVMTRYASQYEWSRYKDRKSL